MSESTSRLNAGLFSSARGDWRTPRDLMAAILRRWPNLVDVSDRQGGRFDALKDPWPAYCYLNPPYGSTIGSWTQKAAAIGNSGFVVVALLPARTDTVWCQRDVFGRADAVYFIKGRLRFDDCAVGAPFPSMLAHYGGASPRPFQTKLLTLKLRPNVPGPEGWEFEP